MKNFYLVLILFLSFFLHSRAQGIDPLNSPYRNNGVYGVTEEINPSSPYLLTYRPAVSAGNFPIVIFGPGANGLFANDINLRTYDLFLKHLASYGYIILITNRVSGGIPDNLFKTTLNWAYNKKGDTSHWVNKLADTSKIIVMGHSFGGVNASQLVSTDPEKVDAVIYLASYPFIFPIFGQDVTKYKGLLLSICGSEDNTTTYAEAKDGYDEYSTSICKNFIEIKGAGHAAFGNYQNATQKIGSIGRDSATATIRHLIVSFLEGKIKNNSTALLDFYSATNKPSTLDTFKTTCDTSFLISSIRNNLNYKSISIFPNPVKDEFLIDGAILNNRNMQLKIYSISGNLVYESILVNNKVNIQSLSSGIYFLVIETGDERWLGKIIKE